MTKRNRSPDGKSRKERIKEITEQLEAGVIAVFESDAYKAWLSSWVGKYRVLGVPSFFTPCCFLMLMPERFQEAVRLCLPHNIILSFHSF